MASPDNSSASTIEHTTKAALAVAGLAYVCGVLILNVYLGQYGFTTGGLGEARYVTIGALWLFVVGVYVVLVLGAGYLLRFTFRQLQQRRFLLPILGALIGLAVLALVGVGFLEVSSFGGMEAKLPRTRYVAVLFALTALVILPTRWTVRTAATPATGRDGDAVFERYLAYFVAGLQVLLILVALVVYAIEAYSHYPSVIGGGMSTPVLLAPSPELVDDMAALGFQVRGGLIGPVDLVFEDEAAFYVLLDRAGRKRPVRFAKDDFAVTIGAFNID